MNFTPMAASLETNPFKFKIIHLHYRDEAANSINLLSIVDKAIENLSIKPHKIKFIVTNRAAYNVKCANDSIKLFTNNSRLFCYAHFFHNIASKIVSYNNDLKDFLTYLNYFFSRKDFNWAEKLNCGRFPVYLKTRWASFLKVNNWYVENIEPINNY